MKTSCSRNGIILDGTENKCGPGKEEWVLDPDAPGFEMAIGTGSCPVDYRDCEVICDKPCKGATWIESNCTRDGVILDGSETDKCGRGMRTYTLDESASDYVASVGRGVCMKTYSSACDIECPQNAVAPPACVYSSTWQKSANGCVVSKDDKARQVGYDEDGWQESFKLALEAENCTGEKRLSEWETCKGPPAPVDCVGTWGPNDGWGTCTGPCGTQPQQTRKYTVTREAKNGGKVCPYENGKEETKNCGTIVMCPSDCEGYYTDPPCPTQCGQPTTTLSKSYVITKNPYGSGRICPTPSSKTCPSTTPCPPIGLADVRYVRVERPYANYPNNIINLAEMEVYDINGTNVARGRRVYGAFGSHDAGPYERLVDGNLSNFAHTGGVNGVSLIEIDLGSPNTIRDVVIYNRHGAIERTQNMVLRFLRSNGDIIYTSSSVEPNKDKMTFNLDTRQWTY
jgi:hypothetical protein